MVLFGCCLNDVWCAVWMLVWMMFECCLGCCLGVVWMLVWMLFGFCMRCCLGAVWMLVWVLLGCCLGLLFGVLVLTPITLAGVFTCAFGVLSDTPFNMSNVVVMPLILGLGVDSGIHVFMRFRHDGSLADAMGSSTPRAVVISALTTLAAFGSLTLSSHRGIQSLGLLLTFSVICLIYCTVVVLPALILLRRKTAPSA